MTDDEQDPEATREETEIEVVIEKEMMVTEDQILEILAERDQFRQTDKEIEMTDSEQDPEVIKEEKEMTEEMMIETEEDPDPIIVEKLTEKFLTPRSRPELTKPSRRNYYALLRVWTAPTEVI